MLQLFNQALLSQGEDQILSLNDGSLEYRMLASNWANLIDAELEIGEYRFAREQVFLQNRVDGLFGYRDGYQIPASALHVRTVWFEIDGGHRPKRVFPDWVQDADAVFVDHPDGVFIEFTATPETNVWSANFSKGIQYRLEAIILRALKEEFSEAQSMDQMAEEYFQRARTTSTKSQSPKEPFKRGPIASARFRRGKA